MNAKEQNTVKQALLEIEPENGAKERMLLAIKRKAGDRSASPTPEPLRRPSPQKKAAVKKIVRWALPAAACFALILLGIAFLPKLLQNAKPQPVPSENAKPTTAAEEQSNGPADTPILQDGSPVEEVEGPPAFLERLGIALSAPEGAQNAVYLIYNSAADIEFDYNGNGYSLLAANQTGDFSGLNGETVRQETVDPETGAVLTELKSGDETYYKITWKKADTVYVLMNVDGAGEAALKALFESVK